MTTPFPMRPHPLLFEVNARQLVQQTARHLDRPDATLADVPAGMVEGWARAGYDAIWLMGAWCTGEIGQRLSAEEPGFVRHYPDVLPDWNREDVCGSPYAVADYTVNRDFGGADALIDLRQRLHAGGMGLILDFVPNHTARDHPWVKGHPDLYVRGTREQAESDPANYAPQDGHVFAFGRDPYFPGWIDTFQLDYRRQETRDRMIDTLLRIADQCDGLRCDMAMLVLKEIFERTWGHLPEGNAEGEFWPVAIDEVRARHPEFRFIAETYWGLEWRLQLLGFDFTYNKSLYDTLVHGDAAAARGHFLSREYLGRSLQFLENHDEPRAAAALPDADRRRAATVLGTALPGARLIHDGQPEGRKWAHSIHLARRKEEEPDPDELAFFDRLFSALGESTVGSGTWSHVDTQGWPGNDSHHNLHAFLWETPDGERDLVIVNMAASVSEANLPLHFQGIAGRRWQLADRLSDAVYERDGDSMSGQGLYVRLEPFDRQIFALTRIAEP